MKNYSYLLSFVLFIFTYSEGAVAQSQLPISEGSFVSSKADCTLLKKGELDFVELSIEQNGRQFSFPEVSCLVAEVKKVRNGRFYVKADCREFEDIGEQQFFLDVLSSKNIRIDGRDLVTCEWDGSAKGLEALPAAKPELDHAGKISDSVKGVKKLIMQWEAEETICRGSNPDDPKTMKACVRRSAVVQALEKSGWCYGTEDQARVDMRWHKCLRDSIRSYD
ncbi:hypothetical protein [Pseudochrobactrum asaccharolyticum]|uniref:hypothetical protein n=1 Tax=Pseudochrobactrum asaccharolyticum TaxID=354351 RepID=UPI004041C2B6